jgi:hypothetical protein
MNTNKQFDDNDELVNKLRRHTCNTPDPVLQIKMKSELEKFRHQLNSHPYIVSKSNAPGLFARIMKHKFIVGQIAGAAVVIISVFAFIFISTDTATYAQINERFKTVPYFTATVYIKDSFLGQSKKFELWMDNGRCRILTGTQVVFGRNGIIEDAYDIVKSARVSPDDTAAIILQRIGTVNAFSLETLLSCVSLNDIHKSSFITVNCVLAEELAIFDKQPVGGDTEAIRIWALQKSKLPIQVKITNGNTSIDVSLVYSEKHSAAFFDFRAFLTRMNQSNNSPEQLAYLFYNTVADSNK